MKSFKLQFYDVFLSRPGLKVGLPLEVGSEDDSQVFVGVYDVDIFLINVNKIVLSFENKKRTLQHYSVSQSNKSSLTGEKNSSNSMIRATGYIDMILARRHITVRMRSAYRLCTRAQHGKINVRFIGKKSCCGHFFLEKPRFCARFEPVITCFRLEQSG